MKNFIFLSPNFPENYWRFCRSLKDVGFRVLGIGDCPYENLTQNLRDSLDEYYRVDDLGSYGEVYRAVAFFLFKYGRADFLESNNEYWLERDARLREDFNIPGLHPADMRAVKYKSAMKERYAAAGIPFARFCLADDYASCRAFLAEAGSAVLKPDNGVGANDTFRVSDERELKEFFARGLRGYIMEEYVDGTVCSYDAVIGLDGQPVFETGNVTPHSLMEIVNRKQSSMFYIEKELPAEVREKGRAAVKSFGVKGRFIHFEFFRLNGDCRLGKKGDVVALEVNMRPSGGCSPDMMNYANSVDVFRIWADMLAGNAVSEGNGEKSYCVFFGRRNGLPYRLSHEDILARYGAALRECAPVPAALSPAMGDTRYIATFSEEREVYGFMRELDATF